MKSCPFCSARLAFQTAALASTLCGAALAPVAAAPAAGTATNAPPNTSNMVPFEFSFPKSVFIYDSATGRDPFFPTSARTLPAAAPTAAAQPTAVAKPGGSETTPRPPTFTVDPYVDLSLKGITGDRRFALINGQPFATGETYKLRTTNGVLSVKCLEIRPRSAVVLIDGQKNSKEIHLRPGL